jgi:ribonuclease P protein component
MPERKTLSGHREFKAVYARGRRATSDGITAIVLETPGVATRTGFAVPAQAAGAVTRNRIRRRLREAVRALMVPSGYRVIIRSDRSTAEAPFPDVLGHLRAALEGAGVKGLPS